jgi:probable DNA repair protein
MLVLRWLVRDLSALEVGLLLRSPIMATSDLAGRSRLELQLRKLPDRAWSPSMITAALRRRDDNTGGSNWFAAVATLMQRRKDIPVQVSPAAWAVYIDETLRSLGWPGGGALDSAEFQLINRWRELLNEFARLDLVSPRMNLGSALSRLEVLAGEIVFQPESTDVAVQLMGPLEASGAEFDAVWISGLTAANWPPAGTASVLISRRLQQKHNMPDANPLDTLQYAESVLQHLMTSAEQTVCSYALTVDNAEQARSEMLAPFASTLDSATEDPGWHATQLVAAEQATGLVDKVPAVEVDEKFHGGAGTVQRQRDEPFSAFVLDRLGARLIVPQAVGITALMRGDIIHNALHKLFVDLPDSTAIQAWHDDDVSSRINAALDSAFARHQRNTGAVLQQLLAIERRRVARLLRQIIAIDGGRGEFEIAGVEGQMEFIAGNIRLPLRFDRIDKFSDGHIEILDYKSGAKKRLLHSGEEAHEIQLFVYACAATATVAALALVNIDSREIAFDGAGRGYTDEAEWPALLQKIKNEIGVACDDLAAGDVRLSIEQGVQAARRLNLLSRFTELRRDF